MTPINNSDLAWLIISDYNEDNGIGFPGELRQDILNPETNHYDYEYDYNIAKMVGGATSRIMGIGDLSARERTVTVGTFINYNVGWADYGVGGNNYDSACQSGGTVGDATE